MRSSLNLGLLLGGGICLASVACASIAGVSDYSVDDCFGGCSEAAAPDGPATPESGAPDDGAVPDAGSTPASCPPGQQICFGVCVSSTDPKYGCGDARCTPCPSSHGTMRCQGRTCVVASCDPGYADCNTSPADGCEGDLSKPATCGACNAACGAAAPQCSAVGPSFQCTNGCAPATPLNCSNECVDPNTSTNHCGSCANTCPVVASGTTGCTIGSCTFSCKEGFHKCGDRCAASIDPTACGADCVVCPIPPGGAATCTNNLCGLSCPAPSHLCGGKCVRDDPTACGASCTACPAPPNTTATCSSEVCGSACAAGYGNCDANAANGCETALMNDPDNCGGCGRRCRPKRCAAGVCQ